MNDLVNRQQIVEHLAEREEKCRLKQRIYGQWLGFLTPIRWGMVGGSIFLSLLASAAVFARPEFMGDKWALWSGVCAFGSAVLTGLHTGLDCDAHQAECRRLVQVYESLEAGYRAATLLSGPELEEERVSLDRQFQETPLKVEAAPPYWFMKRD